MDDRKKMLKPPTDEPKKQPSDKKDINNSEKSEDGLREVIMRIITDDKYKKLLIKDIDKALAEYELTEMQIMLIKSLDPSDIEKLSPENVDEFFSADSAVYTPDIDENPENEEAKEEDI